MISWAVKRTSIGGAEGLDVELAVGAEELEQVNARQVARRVVDVHVLRARVRAVDAVGVGRRVPLVDGRVELQTGVRTRPRRLGDLTPQFASLHGADGLVSVARGQVPVTVGDDRLHELIGDAHRVVGVLVLDRVDVATVEVHVEARVAQRARLLLFVGLAPDELFDVGVVRVEDDHLRRTTRLATGLDGAGRRVGAAHERHRAARRAAAFEGLRARADPREVDARARATLEDDALFGVPVEDRAHRVLDGEDEAGAPLLGDVLHADVEPDR